MGITGQEGGVGGRVGGLLPLLLPVPPFPAQVAEVEGAGVAWWGRENRGGDYDACLQTLPPPLGCWGDGGLSVCGGEGR